jgi:adenosylcobinamide kinase/adenosylcobinamide-phosphate guanylyltransferase
MLVLGGARSGKSRYAEGLATATGLDLVYVATATDHGDPEMQARIARHRAERDARWHTVDAPLDLVGALRRETAASRVVLVDCLTLWLTNVMLGGADVDAAVADLAARVTDTPGPVIFVSNEVGMGIVPDNALARAFRDAQGRLNQRMAAACDTVVFVAAGLPMRLKPSADPAVVIGR